MKHLLKKALQNNSLVKFQLKKKFDSEAYRGFVIGLSEEFALISEIEEWHLNGWRIIKLSTVKKCRYGDYEISHEEILKWKNVLPDLSYDSIDLTNFETIFSCLKKKQSVLTILFDGTADVGIVENISETSVELKAIDPHGRWEDQLAVIEFDEITMICIDEEYGTVLHEFAKKVN